MKLFAARAEIDADDIIVLYRTWSSSVRDSLNLLAETPQNR
jgi:hypothetical protein